MRTRKQAIESMLQEAGYRALAAVIAGKVSHKKAMEGLLALRELSFGRMKPEQVKLYLARHKMLKGTDMTWYPTTSNAGKK